MVNVPAPETAGSKVLPLTPVPLNVPPAVAAVSVAAGSPVHIELRGVMVASGVAETVTVSVSELPQEPPMV